MTHAVIVERHCETCGSPLRRRPSERSSDFQARRFCCRTCVPRGGTGEWRKVQRCGCGLVSAELPCRVCQLEARGRLAGWVDSSEVVGRCADLYGHDGGEAIGRESEIRTWLDDLLDAMAPQSRSGAVNTEGS